MRYKLFPHVNCCTKLILWQIGYTHGQEAQAEIQRGITFYSALFMKTSRLSWQQVQDSAREFDDIIGVKWPRYYQELQGEWSCCQFFLSLSH